METNETHSQQLQNAIAANLAMQIRVTAMLAAVLRARASTHDHPAAAPSSSSSSSQKKDRPSEQPVFAVHPLEDANKQMPPLNEDANSIRYAHVPHMYKSSIIFPSDGAIIRKHVIAENTRILSNNGQSPLPHPSDPRLLTNLDGGIDWARIARHVHVSSPPISARDCEIHYNLWGHPHVNNDLFSREEVFKLAEIGDRIGWMDWRAIAAEMGNGRLPWQCFKLFKKYIDTSSQFWTAEEDAHLRQLVAKHGNNWAIIARSMETRGRLQCQSRWRQNLRPGLSKGKWNSQENQALQDAVEQFGTKNWVSVANAVGTRTEIQCRERYLSVYEPGLLKGKFSSEEIEKLIDLVQVHGTESWSLVAEAMSRTPKMCLRAYHRMLRLKIKEKEKEGKPPRKRKRSRTTTKKK